MVSTLLEPLTQSEIAEARRRITGSALRSPFVTDPTGARFKLECLQPLGSYKIRGATNVVKAALERKGNLTRIVSASAGNFGQAIAAVGRELNVPVSIHVPDNAARVKLDSLRRLGAAVHERSFENWWTIMQTRETGEAGTFFHPVCERDVIAGAATIGQEIVEDMEGVEAVFVPIGGGGLATGIAQAVKMVRPNCRIVAVECDVATPLEAALDHGAPITVERRTSFVDGMGSTRVLDEMWPLLQRYIDDVVIVSLAEIEDAIRHLAAVHHVIAEGAGAASIAASLQDGAQNSVAIVSGGNIDWAELRRILS